MNLVITKMVDNRKLTIGKIYSDKRQLLVNKFAIAIRQEILIIDICFAIIDILVQHIVAPFI